MSTAMEKECDSSPAVMRNSSEDAQQTESPTSPSPAPTTTDCKDSTNSENVALTTTSTTVSTLDKVVAQLKKDGWTHTVDREKGYVETRATGDNGVSFRFVFDIKEEEDIVIVYGISPVTAPESVRLRVVEYITRANYGLKIGSFEMDMADGEIRFKASVEFVGSELSPRMIARLLGSCAYTINHYYAGIMRIIYSHEDAAESIREIEPNQARGGPVTAVAVAQVLEALALSNNDGETLPSAVPQSGAE